METSIEKWIEEDFDPGGKVGGVIRGNLRKVKKEEKGRERGKERWRRVQLMWKGGSRVILRIMREKEWTMWEIVCLWMYKNGRIGKTSELRV